jgi:hypothetical protein
VSVDVEETAMVPPGDRLHPEPRHEPLIFERSGEGKVGYSMPPLDVPAAVAIPPNLVRAEIAGETEVTEVEVARHFTRLSRLNFSIDEALYPLGSCTMKHNPRVNEEVARLPGFAAAHPLAPEEVSQGALELAWRLERPPTREREIPGRRCSSRTRRTARTPPRRTSRDTGCAS